MTARGLVVAGPASGVGKTTVTLGLIAALVRRSLIVQPFKCGPDFLDPGHHTRASRRVSRNLDGWMLDARANRAIVARQAADADVVIVEGVMGLFDGVSGSITAGSTAEMAKSLGLPVVLVVDAARMGPSAAALVSGFARFDPALRVAGVIFNQVGSPRHYELLRDAVARSTEVAALGYLPRDGRVHVPERHLGLVTAGEAALSDAALDALADLVEQHVDVARVLELAAHVPVADADLPPAATPARATIGVARDRAFCFYYEDNLDQMREAGADLVPFSPLEDATLPPVDALYLGGGYPEIWAEPLSRNDGMRRAIRAFADTGRPVYAECGGLMYLAEAIRQRDGHVWPMAGVLPVVVEMTDRLQRFGYVEVTLTADCLLGCAGETARGHSFHYSRLVEDPSGVERAYRVRYTLSDREEAEGFVRGGVLASYAHLHFRSNAGLAARFVAAAADARRRATSTQEMDR